MFTFDDVKEVVVSQNVVVKDTTDQALVKGFGALGDGLSWIAKKAQAGADYCYSQQREVQARYDARHHIEEEPSEKDFIFDRLAELNSDIEFFAGMAKTNEVDYQQMVIHAKAFNSYMKKALELAETKEDWARLKDLNENVQSVLSNF